MSSFRNMSASLARSREPRDILVAFQWTFSTAILWTYITGTDNAGVERIAMRSGTDSGTAGLVWIVGDHLGSTAFTVNAATGLKQSERRYKPWGEVRYTEGEMGTKYGFTGQMAETAGLYFYHSRFYDSLLGRFVQADTLIFDTYNPLAWDRYSYTKNNPVRWIDPSGHVEACLPDEPCHHDYPSYLDPWRQPPEKSMFGADRAFADDPLQLLLNHLRSPLPGGTFSPSGGCNTVSTSGCGSGYHAGADSSPGYGGIGTPIRSTGYGKVVATGHEDFGNYVVVEHCTYDGTCYYSVYAHLDSIDVKVGQTVDNRTVIGGMGGTGPNPDSSFSPHLHFEIRTANNLDLSSTQPFSSYDWWPRSLMELYEDFVDLSLLPFISESKVLHCLKLEYADLPCN